MGLLKVGHVNSRSIPCHIDDLIMLCNNRNYDVLCVSETWLKNSVPATQFNIPGYYIFRQDRLYARSGGVAIYVRDSFHAEVIGTSPDSCIDFLWLSIKVGKHTVVIGCLYRPHLPLSSQIELISCSIESIITRYSHVMICGDVNIDFLKPSCPNFQSFKSMYEAYDLRQMIGEPTRITDNSSTLLDYLLALNHNLVSNVKVIPVAFSDHCLYEFNYSIETSIRKCKTIFRRCYKHFDLDGFNNDAESANWDAVYGALNINDKLETFNNVVIDLFNKHAPIHKVKIKRPVAPWLTSDIRTQYNRRDAILIKLHKLQAKKSPLFIDQINLLKTSYKEAKNHCNYITRIAKKKLFEDNINKNANNSKELWKFLKKFGIIEVPDPPKSQSSAEDLNDFFISHNNAIIDDTLLQNEILSVTRSCIYPSFILQHVTPEMVLDTVTSITTKSCGWDNISIDMILKCLPFCLLPLTYIINYSISSNVFPTAWKYAHVCPIPKIQNPLTPRDFRPISLLPVLTKVIEKLVCIQVFQYLNDHLLLQPLQSGFRKCHSTASALLKIISDIINAIDDQEVTILALLDFSKAFDTVNHKLLLAKLKSLGFMESTIDWFNSYLSGRQQRVVFDNSISSWLLLNNGVPQGSILGPLLFILMTHDLSDNIKFSNHHMYADDTQLYIHDKICNIPQAISNLNSDLNAIKNWSECNFLKLNESKSLYMFIGSINKIKSLRNLDLSEVSINGTPIPLVTKCKNLGVIVDENLTWESHINSIISKSYYKLRSLYKYKHFLSANIKKTLCDSLVLSYFNYCDILFSNITSALAYKIQKVQNACLRYIFSLRRFDHVSQFLSTLNWLNMANRRRFHGLCFAYNIVSDLAPGYLKDFINRHQYNHMYFTRFSNAIPVPSANTRIKQLSFFISTVNDFNNLPNNIKSASSLTSFKSRLKRHLLSAV